ncbi:permease, partial [Candidatus Woesearchaeota archaeon]|nr:permease [Candidatus Woesearchaeota archaeon]
MLQQIVDWLTYSIIGLDPASRLGESLNFFLYDVVKILLLLFLMIFTVGFLRTYIPQERVKNWLGGKRLGLGNIAAALFGAITPFCSCSSIPV